MKQLYPHVRQWLAAGCTGQRNTAYLQLLSKCCLRILPIILTALPVWLKAQTAGDYRSAGTPLNWGTAAGWQKYNGTAWVASADFPGQTACGSCKVTIQNGHTVTLNVSPANAIGSLEVGGGANGTLTLSNTLTVSGNLAVLTGATLNLSTGNLTVQGTSNLAGTVSDNSNTGMVSFAGLVTKTGGTWNSTAVTTAANLVFQNGLTNNTGAFSAGAATIGDNKTLTGTANISFANGLVVSGNGDLTVAGTANNGVTFGGTGIHYLVRNLNLTGRLSVTTTGNLTVSGATSMTGAGSFVDNNNTGITSFTGAVVHNSTGAWSTTSVTTPANLVFNSGFSNVAGTFNAGGATLSSGQVLNGNVLMTFNRPVVITGAGHLTITGTAGVRFAGTAADYVIPGNLVLTGRLQVTTTGNFTVSGTTQITGAGDFSDNNNTGISTFTGHVTHNSTGRWVSTSVTNPANMIFMSGFTNTAGSFSAGGATVGNLQTLTGTVNMSFTRGLVVLGNGDISIAGTATTGVTLGGTGIHYSFRNLTVSGLLTVSTSGNLTVTGTSTISGGLVDNNNSGTSTFSGAVNLSSTGQFTATSVTTMGRLVFGGGLSQQNTTALAFNVGTVRTNGTQTWSGAGNIRCAGEFNVASGTLQNNVTGPFTIAGTLSGTTFTQGTSAQLFLSGATPLSLTTLNAVAAGNTVTYNGGSVTLRGQTYHHLTIAGSGTKTMPATDITVNGNLTLAAGVLSNSTNNRNIYLAGSWLNNSSATAFTAGTGTVFMNGSALQTLGGSFSTSFRNLHLNNTAGFTQAVNNTVTGILTLASGILSTGSTLMIINNTGGVSRTSGHINGNLQRYVATGANVSRVFDIGDAGRYGPVTLTFASVTTGGYVTARTTGTDHPSVTSGLLNSSRSVNRYWTLSNSGTVFNQYNAVLQFSSADLDAGVRTDSLKGGRFSGNWTYPANGTRTATSTQLTGLTAWGDLAVAEHLVCLNPTVVITNPAPFCSPASVNLTAPAVTAGSTPGCSFTYWQDAAATLSLATPAAVGTGGTYYIKGTVSGGCADIEPVLVTRNNPTAAISGTSTICTGASAALSVSVTGSGPWTVTLSDGTPVSGNTSPLTVSVSPAAATTYTVASLSDAACSAQSADLSGSAVISIAPLPTPANAGADQSICGSAAVLAANVPAVGTGNWSVVSGTGGSFSNASSAGSTFNGVSGNSYVLRWSISNASCPVNSNDVHINFSSGVWTGAADDNWNNPANWCGGVIPSAAFDLVLTSGLPHYPRIDENINLDNLTVHSGASLLITKNGTLSIRGDYAYAGTLTNNGSIILNGLATQSFPGSTATVTAMNELEIDNESGVQIDQSFSISGVLTSTQGTLYLNDKTITLASGPAGTARVAPVGGEFDYSGGGQFAVQRYVPARRAWHLITTPLTQTGSIYANWQNGGVYTPGAGTLITGASTTGTGFDAISGSSLKIWDVNSQTLAEATSTLGNLSPGSAGSADNMAYFLFVRGDRHTANLSQPNTNNTTLTSRGQLQTGPQVFNASNQAGRFTLVGNPYASPVNFNLMARTNLVKRFYVWDPTLNTVGGYVTMDDVDNDGEFSKSVSGSSQTEEILSQQSFFVETLTNGAAGLSFDEDSKSDGSTYLISRPSSAGMRQRLQINLRKPEASGSVLADGVVAELGADWANTYGAEDALKFANINETFALMRDNRALAIERKQMPQTTDTLFLRLSRHTQRRYELEFIPGGLAAQPFSLSLKDEWLGTETPLSATDTTRIAFDVTADAAAQPGNRFRVILRPYSVLPVKFSYIQAEQAGQQAAVQWTVEAESGIRNYTVEVSADGRHFNPAATVPARSNGSSRQSYRSAAGAVSSQLMFFRVRANGMDGAAIYSAVVRLQPGHETGGIRVYPNPVVQRNIQVQLTGMPQGNWQARLLNDAGQPLLISRFQLSGTAALHSLKAPESLPAGIYHLELTGPDQQLQFRQVVIP